MFYFRFFKHLSVHGDRMRFDLAHAGREERKCQDLMSQAQYHVARARRVDEEERALRRKQEEERENFRQKQRELMAKAAEERKLREEAMLVKRKEYVEKTKNALLFAEMPSEKSAKKGGRHRREDASGDEENEEPRQRKGKGSGGKGRRYDINF